MRSIKLCRRLLDDTVKSAKEHLLCIEYKSLEEKLFYLSCICDYIVVQRKPTFVTKRSWDKVKEGYIAEVNSLMPKGAK